jgi:hypothetical protein
MAAGFGLLVVQIGPAGATNVLIHGRACGDIPAPAIPMDRKSPDCPAPCHAACPRKYATLAEDDSYTG